MLPVHRRKVRKSRPSSRSLPKIETRPLANCKEFHTGHDLDLGNTVGVTEDDTDLGGSGTLLGQLADVVDNLVRGGLEPRGSGARVGESGGGNALALGVKTTHFG